MLLAEAGRWAPSRSAASHSVAAGSAAGVALGANSKVTNASGVSVGGNSSATGTNAVALGYFSGAAGNNSVAVGISSSASTDNSVGLGANSSTGAVVATTGVTLQGNAYTFAGAAPVGTQSVGSNGNERTITNVAAGRLSGTSTDAVNGSQLFATNQALDAINNGGGVKYFHAN